MWFVWPLFSPSPFRITQSEVLCHFSTIKAILHFDEAFFPRRPWDELASKTLKGMAVWQTAA